MNNFGKQFVSEAGPRQTKQVKDAISSLKQLATCIRKVTDHGEFVSNRLFGEDTWPLPRATLLAIGDKWEWKITRENFKDIIRDLEAAAISLSPQIPVEDTRTTPEQRAERDRLNKEAEQQRKQEADIKARNVADRAAELRAIYPWAKPASNDMANHVRAAANLRVELARAFPGISFRVRSDSYSMGNSVDVYWTDGPSAATVQAISGKYQQGSFNGMIDMYEDDRSADGEAVSIVLGRTKFCHTHRDISPETWAAVKPAFGGTDYEQQSAASRLLAETDLPPGATVLRVAWDEKDGQYIQYTAPPAPKPIGNAADAEEPTENAAMVIESHCHTKRQKNVFICVLKSRISDGEFLRLRSSCKRAGGWYLRKWGGVPGGFAFMDEAAAAAWMNGETVKISESGSGHGPSTDSLYEDQCAGACGL